MGKKKGPKYKHISQTELETYSSMSTDELTRTLYQKFINLEEAKKKKKGSSYLKELVKEIADYRKGAKSEEIEEAKARYDELKDERDAKIADDLQELKDIRGGFDDAIKAQKEHVDFLLKTLAQPDLFRDN